MNPESRVDLSVEEAYRAQYRLLARQLESGEKLAGWKMALTNQPSRDRFGSATPVCGYLLERGRFASGATVSLASSGSFLIESEICLTMGRRLAGPGVTRAQVLDALAGLAPAFELAEHRITGTSARLPQLIADNVSCWGIVAGATRPCPVDLDLTGVVVEATRNGSPLETARSGVKVDEQLNTVAWLANHLSAFGLALEAGQCILTGSITRTTPVADGDLWESHFLGIGKVSARIACRD